MKNSRQEKIVELIKSRAIVTQDELQEILYSLGYNVTQSTISRDLKQLRVLKALDSDGNYKYILPEQTIKNGEPYSSGYYHDLFTKSVKTVESAFNDVVIKCYSGMASSVGVVVDELYDNYIVGSLAGDDTVLVITKDTETALELVGELKKMI